MQNDKWEQIIDVFNSALEEKESERRAFVEQQLKGDDEALQEVIELLEFHKESEDFIEKPPAEFVAEVFENGKKSHIGKTIGVYKIVEQIGHGGMGTVFLGIRSDKEFDQKVAIKLLKRGMDTDAIIQRFRYERQILAELNHPHIARLLDGGTTENGLPYFVLEYIEGVPITEYCKEKELGLNERLKLFRQVCGAISYAHQNLVVHRDIKPSNILVTDEGVPKLLDFGIAKVIQADAEVTNVTVAGERLMTPKYASPEQVKGEIITTSTDVYSLGVLLYELLTGTLPYKIESASPKQIERIVSEQEPIMPSKESISTFSIKDARLLKGDLDNIVLMALEKDSAKRYQNVDEFSADIGRYLKGLPIIARKNTFVYRAKKFVKRNVLAVGALAVFSVLIIVFLVNAKIQANQIAKEQNRSEKVLAFMKDIFKENNPTNAGNKDISARELLDLGVVKIETEFESQPDVKAELMNTVGQVYESLGLYDKAEKLLSDSLEIRRDFFGRNSKESAETLLNVANVQRLKADFDASQKSFDETLEIHRKLFGEKSAKFLKAKQKLVLLKKDTKQLKEQQQFAKEVLVLSREIHGDETVETAEASRQLAMALTDKPEDAEKFAREALEINQKVNPKANEQTIKTLDSLVKILFYLRRDFDEAEKFSNQSLKMSTEVYGNDHPQVSDVYKTRAWLFEVKKDFTKGAVAWQDAIDIEEKLYGENHPQIATTLNSLGANYFNRREFEKAYKTWQKALKIRQKSLGEEHPEVTWVISNLALLAFEEEKFVEAETLFRESLRIQKKGMPANHPQIGYSMIGLGKTILQKKRAVEAEKLLREGIAIVNNSVDQYSWNSEEAENALGYSLLLQKKYDAAEKKLTSTYEKIKEKNGNAHKKTIQAKKHLNELSNIKK